MEKFRVVKEIPGKEYLTGHDLFLLCIEESKIYSDLRLLTKYKLYLTSRINLKTFDILYGGDWADLTTHLHPLEYNGVFEAVKEEVKKEHTDEDIIEFANYCWYNDLGKVYFRRCGDAVYVSKKPLKELLDEFKKQKTT